MNTNTTTPRPSRRPSPLSRHRRGKLVILIILCALAIPCAPSALAASEHRLDNGLTVFIAPRSDPKGAERAPLVSLQFSIRHGYAYARDGSREGIAHFYEHMLFKANSLTKSQPEFMRELNRMGAAGWNGSTSGELVTYFLTVPLAEFENALRLWSAVLIDTVFDDGEIQREVSVVSNEIEGNKKLPERILWRTVNTSLFTEPWRTGHYENAALRGFTRPILVCEKKRWYVPDNCLISLSGAVEEADALALVARYFGRWQRGGMRPSVRPLALRPALEQRILTGFTNPSMAELVVVWNGPITLKDRAETLTADVLADLISENSGPWLRELTERSALFSIDSSSLSFYTGRYSSEFVFQGDIAITNTDTLTHDAHQVFREVNDMFAKIARGEHTITPADIQRIVRKNINARIFRHEKPNSYLHDLNWSWSAADIEYFLEYENGLAAVSVQDIERLAARWLAEPRLELLWVHDEITKNLAPFPAEGEAR